MSEWLDRKIRALEIAHKHKERKGRLPTQGVKGDFQQMEALRRANVRGDDRYYFSKQLGSFLDGKEIHHIWVDGDRCLLLGKQEHRDLHNGKGGHS